MAWILSSSARLVPVHQLELSHITSIAKYLITLGCLVVTINVTVSSCPYATSMPCQFTAELTGHLAWKLLGKQLSFILSYNRVEETGSYLTLGCLVFLSRYKMIYPHFRQRNNTTISYSMFPL